jgi:hypothetical protein
MTDKSTFFSMDNFLILRDISYGFIFVPVASSWIKWKVLTRSQRRITMIAILSLIVEIMTRYMSKNKIDSLPVFHVYMPILFMLISGVYYSTNHRILRKKGFMGVSILFYAFVILNTVFFQPIAAFNTNVIAMASFVFIVFAIIYFYRLIQASTNEYFLQDPILWFNVGNLLYYSSMFILFVVVEKNLDGDLQALAGVWILNAFFYIVLNMCYSIAIWVKPQTS